MGLLSSGNWAQCQAAVDAVLAGSPILEINAAPMHPNPNPNPGPPFQSCDIRHVYRDANFGKTRNRFKRSMTGPKIQLGSITEPATGPSSSQGGQSVETVEAPWVMNRSDPDPVGNIDGLELTLGLA